MSRSFKKSPHRSVCKGHNDSDKLDKQLANGAFRRNDHIAIQSENYEALPINLTEGRNIYSFVSDGPKQYYKDLEKKWLRK